MIEFGGRVVRIEAVEWWRCGSNEMVDVQGVDETTIQRYECTDCSICDTCRHYEGYKCPEWPACYYKI